jgi:alkylation response protein AidB-like acyl-CoA dehydrogenase
VGGAGGTFVDAALVLEQLGLQLVPEPFLSQLVAGRALMAAADDAQKRRFLEPLVAGTRIFGLAYAETHSRYDLEDMKTTALPQKDGFTLRGEKRFVLDGSAADAFIVAARAEDGIGLFVIDKDTPGLTVTPVQLIDGHKAAHIAMQDIIVEPERRLRGDGGAALELAIDSGAAAACAEGLGILRAVLDMTCDYLRTREQFGVKIGTFQALQHRAVEMFIEVELCKSTALLASIKADDIDPQERRSAISAAKVQLGWGGRLVTQQAIQLHGGIGVTDEHDVGLYFKRMLALNALFGDEEHHVGRFVSLPAFTASL